MTPEQLVRLSQEVRDAIFRLTYETQSFNYQNIDFLKNKAKQLQASLEAHFGLPASQDYDPDDWKSWATEDQYLSNIQECPKCGGTVTSAGYGQTSNNTEFSKGVMMCQECSPDFEPSEGNFRQAIQYLIFEESLYPINSVL